jgi:Phage capsid family
MRTATATLVPVEQLERRFRDAATRRALDELRHDVAAQIRQVADEMDNGGDDDQAEYEHIFATLKGLLDRIGAKISRQAVIDDLDTRAARGAARDRADRGFDASLAEFSLRGMIAHHIGSPIPGLDLGRSMEISQELRRRPGRTFQGFPVPYQALFLRADYARTLERRADVISTGLPAPGPGGNLIPLTLDAGRYIDALRARTVVRAAGAQVISDLVGDLDIPRMKQTGQVAWFREGEDIIDTDQQFDRVSFRPKHCGAISTYSRNMLLQSTPDIEMIIRDDLSRLLALDMDRVALTGSGQGAEPLGICRNPNVRRLDAAEFSYLNNVALRAMLTGANVPLESLGWVGNSVIGAYSLSALDATSRPLGRDLIFLQFPAFLTNVATAAAVAGDNALPAIANPLILGAWSDMFISFWSELDILPNAFADRAYRTGAVMIRALMTADVGLRHDESFVWQEVTEGPTLPPLIQSPAAPEPIGNGGAVRSRRAA